MLGREAGREKEREKQREACMEKQKKEEASEGGRERPVPCWGIHSQSAMLTKPLDRSPTCLPHRHRSEGGRMEEGRWEEEGGMEAGRERRAREGGVSSWRN
jgi:hypothetical protein